MAITHPYASGHGFDVAKAYIFIKSFNFEKGRDSGIHALAEVYVNEQAKKDGKSSIGQVTFPFVYDPLGPNIFVQAYTAMKALPELSGSDDAQKGINYTPISGEQPEKPGFLDKVLGIFK